MLPQKVSSGMAQVEKGLYLEGILFEVCSSSVVSDTQLTLVVIVEYCIVSGTGPTRLALQMKLGQSKQYSCLHIHSIPKQDTPRYLVLNRSGSVNELESSSRGFSPMDIFAEIQ